MADRTFHPVRSLTRELITLEGKFTTSGAGAVGTISGKGFTVTKPGAAGLYRVTLEDIYNALHDAQATVLKSAVLDARVQAQVVDVAAGGNKRVDLQVYKGVDDRQIEFKKAAADGAAGTTTAENMLGRMPFAGVVSSVHYCPDAALVADNANYATLIVWKRNAAGGAQVKVAEVTTQIAGGSGNWVQFAPVNVPIVAGAVVADDGILFQITKTGTGVVVPAGTLAIRYSDLRGLDLISGEVHFKLGLVNTDSP